MAICQVGIPRGLNLLPALFEATTRNLAPQTLPLSSSPIDSRLNRCAQVSQGHLFVLQHCLSVLETR